MKVEIDNVDEVLTRMVQDQGRITGLSDFMGKKVKVLVLCGRECKEEANTQRDGGGGKA
jgi:hypothetical protein